VRRMWEMRRGALRKAVGDMPIPLVHRLFLSQICARTFLEVVSLMAAAREYGQAEGFNSVVAALPSTPTAEEAQS